MIVTKGFWSVMKIKYKKYVYTGALPENSPPYVVFERVSSLCDLRPAYIVCPYMARLGTEDMNIIEDEYRWTVFKDHRDGLDDFDEGTKYETT